MTSQTPGLDRSEPDGRQVLAALASAIHDNAARLSSIDGATGDGDHGVNMDKGFGRAAELVAAKGPIDLAEGLRMLGDVLITEIGGAMGPLYGSFFLEMALEAKDATEIDTRLFGRMLAAGLAAVREMGSAEAGDKTLLDALVPAEAAFRSAATEGAGLGASLGRMADAAEDGAESTRDMVARVGRASRLGERSLGFLDAGAVSCAVILRSLAETLSALLPIDSGGTAASTSRRHHARAGPSHSTGDQTWKRM